MSKHAIWLAVVLWCVAGAGVSWAQSYLDLENQIQEFTLDNGIRFLVLERHEVPVFSFVTTVAAGSANETMGYTGVAHLLEHMAFKGTEDIGTLDRGKERKAMAREDEAFTALKAERLKGSAADPDRLAELEQAFEDAKAAALELVEVNEFSQIVENNGGRGLNAGTGKDMTMYYYHLPSNRLELWAYLEGQRMCHPVLREFYTEKDGPVTEERRMYSDNNPITLLLEQFQNVAFISHPYHHSIVGYMDDLKNMDRAYCEEFYRKNYVGSALTVSVVGDVEFDQVRRLAEKHFSDLPAGEPPVVERTEPTQRGEKRVMVEHSSQPICVIGYHTVGIDHPDKSASDALASILGQGRTSRLHKALVNEQKIAVNVGAFSGYPGEKYPNLFLIYAIPAKDVTAAELEAAVLEEVDRLRAEGATAAELASVKRRTRAQFIRGLRGNFGMAQQLSYFQAMTGDWRNTFRQAEKIDAVTLADIRRVADETLVANNRTVGHIVTAGDES